jgi:hypothetical protein
VRRNSDNCYSKMQLATLKPGNVAAQRRGGENSPPVLSATDALINRQICRFVGRPTLRHIDQLRRENAPLIRGKVAAVVIHGVNERLWRCRMIPVDRRRFDPEQFASSISIATIEDFAVDKHDGFALSVHANVRYERIEGRASMSGNISAAGWGSMVVSICRGDRPRMLISISRTVVPSSNY